MRNEGSVNPIIERIIKESNVPDLMEVLTERISMTDLQSLLLEVYRRRAARLSASTVLKQYNDNRFVRPVSIPPQEFIEFDQLAYSLLPDGFEAVELSPVSPLGTCSVLGAVDQNNTVATIRNTEVCADSTNVLALEYASRRKQSQHYKKLRDVKLCASHRLLRGQLFKGVGMVPHFRVFSLCTAGHDRGNSRFEVEALDEHVNFYIRLLVESARLGFGIGLIRVIVSPFEHGRSDVLQGNIIQKLAVQYPEVKFELDTQRQTGRGYYIWAGFQVMATDAQNKEWFLVDGGFTDWANKLMSSDKERLLISGMGTERFVGYFGRSSNASHAE